MKSLALLRTLVLTALAVTALGYGCGRTSLDDGLLPDETGSGGGAGTSPHGGASGGGTAGTAPGLGGRGGTGGRAQIPCSSTSCTAGAQVCCTQFVNGRPIDTCVPANDPAACPGGSSAACLDRSSCAPAEVCCLLIGIPLSSTCAPAGQCAGTNRALLCGSDATCPSDLPSCCILPIGVGICSPRMSCMGPGR